MSNWLERLTTERDALRSRVEELEKAEVETMRAWSDDLSFCEEKVAALEAQLASSIPASQVAALTSDAPMPSPAQVEAWLAKEGWCSVGEVDLEFGWTAERDTSKRAECALDVPGRRSRSAEMQSFLREMAELESVSVGEIHLAMRAMPETLEEGLNDE